MYYPTRCSADFFIVRKYLGYSFLYPRVDAGNVWYTQPRPQARKKPWGRGCGTPIKLFQCCWRCQSRLGCTFSAEETFYIFSRSII